MLDFIEIVEDFGSKVGVYSQMNEYMKTWEMKVKVIL